jgi:hypothetical protein
VGAGDLKPGDKVRQADGTTGRVVLVKSVQETRTMYNLSVDTAHTFFVGEGQWLVHNSDSVDLRRVGLNEAERVAKALGYEGVHELKEGYLGGNIAKFDIYVDKKTGEYYIADKKGKIAANLGGC